MKEAKIGELKNQLSRYLALVRKGQIVRVLDRDVPIAQIVPISHVQGEQPAGAESLIALERKGILRRGSGKIPREILAKNPPGRPSSGVLAALLEERELR
jgi:antitoxin (DNA-binding transcriptional repressor) of toxin-antitoxin stability system